MRTRGWLAGGVAGAVLVLIGALLLLRGLDQRVEARFRGRLFAVPSRVYSAPLVLYPGLDIARAGLLERLHWLHYHVARGSRARPGEYQVAEHSIEIALHPFRYAYRHFPGGTVRLDLAGGSRIATLRDEENRDLPTAQLEPERLAEFHGASRDDRRLVRLAEVPQDLVQAVLALEDRRFYEHSGVRLGRIVAAVLANLRAGRIVQGGSTLTQQLVKNLYLSAERTLRRKTLEAIMALLLERRHGKDEILQAYLNEVYMGQRGSVSIHGVGEAARYYFARDVSDLTLAEAALLAGMIKGPALYSPYRHPEAALRRRNLALRVLLEDHRIAEPRYENAKAKPLGVRGFEPHENSAPYFVAFLREDLARVYGDEILASEGMSIFSTLDPRAQRIAQQAVRAQLARLETDFPGLRRETSPLQAALVAIIPTTGEIVALVGGRDYAKSQFNRVTQARRQPGSAFKPVVALAALSADEEGKPRFTLASRLNDTPLRVATPTGDWKPTNYDGRFRGSVTLRRAIEASLNVPTVRLGLALGAERIIRTARKLGIQSRLQDVPSLALGAFEVTPLELARAYTVFANGGRRPRFRSYSEIVDETGRVLEHDRLDFERVYTPAEVFLVTSMLEGAVDHGTGRALRSLGLRGEVAGKTGTTNDFRDAWFMGYTPELLVGVWVGFDDGQSIGIPGSVAALPIFGHFVRGVLGSQWSARFQRPFGLEQVAIDHETGLRGGRGCPGRPELFLRGSAPRRSCGPSPRGVDRWLDWFRSWR